MTGGSQIRRQILAVALVPAFLIALVLTLFYLHTRLEGLEESMRTRVHATAEGLATASEFALFSGDVTHLHNLGVARSLRSSDDFEAGMLRNAGGEVLFEWGATETWRTPRDEVPITEGDQLVDGGRRLVYHHPVSVAPGPADNPLTLGGEPPAAAAEPRLLGWVTLQYSRAPLRAQRDRIVLNSILITLGGLLLGGVFAYRMSAALGERIHHLADTVRRIGRGELESRARVDSRGELGVLEQGINHMAAALGQARQRMQQEIDAATSQLRESLKTVAEQESRYRELVQNANSIVLKIDLEGRITFFNEFAESFFGYAEAEVLGKPVVGILVDARFAPRVAELLDDPEGVPATPARHHTRDGHVVYVNWSLRQLQDDAGRRAGLIAIGNDVTENHRISRAIGLLSQAGTRSSAVFEDVARALAIGLACDSTGVVEAGAEHQPARLLTLIGGLGAPVETDSETLASSLAAATAGGRSLAFGQALARQRPDLRELPVATESLYAEPILDRSGRVAGCVFATRNTAWHPPEAGRNLLRLTARRLALELQHLADAQLLTRTRDEALAATEAKSRFLANVSHEIRTPMNGIIGFSKLLLREELTQRQHDQVEMIQQSAHSLLAIINDILDLSKIEAGKLTVGRAGFDLVETLEELIATFAVQAHQKGLEICHHLDGALPRRIVGDAQRLVQILTNLLGNAVKFTERGVVRLAARRLEGESGPRLRLEVSDTGVGIAAEDLDRLFDPFSQLDATATRHHTGTGLGLAISRQLCELLGGSIGVSSVPGEGSCFWVELPLESAGGRELAESAGHLLADLDVVYLDREPRVLEAGRALLQLAGARVTTVAGPAQLHDAIAAQPDMVVVGQPVDEPAGLLCDEHLPTLRANFRGPVLVLTCDTINPVDTARCRGCNEWCKPKPLLLRTLEQGHSQRIPVQHDGDAASGWLAGRSVLVCDDNAVNRALAVTLLEQYGARVVEARDGLEAIELAGRGVELLLMDLQMPGMSGTEAARRIRERLGGACPPMIALTASAMQGERERSLAAGLDDHLTKPLDETQLIETLRRWLPGVADPPHADAPSQSTGEGPDGTRIHDTASALAITGGRPELMHKMLHLFLDEAPGHRTELDSGWRGNDPGLLKAALHKLHGSAEYCALARLARAAGDAEQMLASDGMRDIERALEHVRVELDRAVAEARRQLDAQG